MGVAIKYYNIDKSPFVLMESLGREGIKVCGWRMEGGRDEGGKR